MNKEKKWNQKQSRAYTSTDFTLNITFAFFYTFRLSGDQKTQTFAEFPAVPVTLSWEEMGPLTLAELVPHFTRWASLQLS